MIFWSLGRRGNKLTTSPRQAGVLLLNREEKFVLLQILKFKIKLVLHKFPRRLLLRRGGLNHGRFDVKQSFFQAGVVELLKYFNHVFNHLPLTFVPQSGYSPPAAQPGRLLSRRRNSCYY
jgi:hypothetical protein